MPKTVPWLEVVGPIEQIETIAVGAGIRDLSRLRRLFGDGNWRKLKGRARVRLADGSVEICEIHWYEAHGIGKRRMKIKRVLG